MKIAFGCDHRGFALKSAIIDYLQSAGHEVVDAGTYSSERAEYPIYGEKVGRLVASGECDLGVLACGTGFGISIAAAAVKGIRAVCCSDVYTAEFTRRHNNANIISMGACVVGPEYAVRLVEKFINTPFEGGRHANRIGKVAEIQSKEVLTGKQMPVVVAGKQMRFLNQRCREWSHLYEYQGSGATLSSAGCGIFSTCHAVEFMCGERIDVEELADFSCSVGGRGDDGTDRPMLLKGMVEAGLDKKYNFKYNLDGHLNDHEALWECLSNGGCALSNIRVGHIVALLGCRVAEDGEKQVLVLDCHSESADDRVREQVREVVPGTEVCYPVYNEKGVMTGKNTVYGAFWVPLSMPMDFDLLHKC